MHGWPVKIMLATCQPTYLLTKPATYLYTNQHTLYSSSVSLPAIGNERCTTCFDLIVFLTSFKDSLGVSYLTWEIPCPLLQLPQHLSIILSISSGIIPNGWPLSFSLITKGGLWNQLVVILGGHWHFAAKIKK